MKSGTITKLTVLAAALASSLIFTFSAFATTRPDDRSGVRGPGAVVTSHGGSGEPGLAARPDNRAGALGVGTSESASAADTSNGFDWTAAGIGAGATGAFVVLVAAAAMLALPRRRRAIA
jgi:hypothetical protein